MQGYNIHGFTLGDADGSQDATLCVEGAITSFVCEERLDILLLLLFLLPLPLHLLQQLLLLLLRCSECYYYECALRKVNAIPPPTIILSTLESMFWMSWILSETWRVGGALTSSV